MSRGRRYEGGEKLNLKKVFAVVGVIAVIVLFVFIINKLLKSDKNTIASKNIELNYMSLYKDGNWGIINSSGETIIEPANGEMYEIPDKSKAVFVCTYDVSTVDDTFKTKAVNDKNQELFTGYENIFTVQNYDEKNNLWYEKNVLKVQKDGKFGLINLEGNEILPCEYDSIGTIKGVENSLIVKKDSNVGLVNNTGKVIIPVEYSEIETISKDYKDGYLVKNTDSKYGIINSEGNVVLECKYDDIKKIKDDNNYIVKEDGTWKVVAEDGTTFLEGKVANAEDMDNGNVIIKEKGKYSVINTNTDVKIPADYSGIAYLFDDKYVAIKDGKYGVININNEEIVSFKYENITYNKTTEYLKAKNEDGTIDYMTKDFSVKLTAGDEILLNGFIAIKNGDDLKYYNYKLEEKSNKDVYTANTLFITKENGKYGFIDKDGKVTVEAKYDDAREQNDYGFVAVKKDGKWGSIDQYGKVVIEPTYVIKNEENIDFVGRWHNCADNNADFYSDLNDLE